MSVPFLKRTLFKAQYPIHETAYGVDGTKNVFATLDGQFVVKIFSDIAVESEFFVELNAHAHIKHPLILPMIAFTVSGQRGFFVFKKCMNINTALCFSYVDQLTIFAHSLVAIKFLNDNGWVHGDVKPSNMVFDAANRLVLLIDLGRTRMATQNLADNRFYVSGTSYTPPFYCPSYSTSQFNEIGCEKYPLISCCYWFQTGKLPPIGGLHEFKFDSAVIERLRPMSLLLPLDQPSWNDMLTVACAPAASSSAITTSDQTESQFVLNTIESYVSSGSVSRQSLLPVFSEDQKVEDATDLRFVLATIVVLAHKYQFRVQEVFVALQVAYRSIARFKSRVQQPKDWHCIRSILPCVYLNLAAASSEIAYPLSAERCQKSCDDVCAALPHEKFTNIYRIILAAVTVATLGCTNSVTFFHLAKRANDLKPILFDTVFLCHPPPHANGDDMLRDTKEDSVTNKSIRLDTLLDQSDEVRLYQDFLVSGNLASALYAGQQHYGSVGYAPMRTHPLTNQFILYPTVVPTQSRVGDVSRVWHQVSSDANCKWDEETLLKTTSCMLHNRLVLHLVNITMAYFIVHTLVRLSQERPEWTKFLRFVLMQTCAIHWQTIDPNEPAQKLESLPHPFARKQQNSRPRARSCPRSSYHHARKKKTVS